MDAIAGTTTRYYYDDQRVLLETDATGTEFDIRCFVYGNYIDEVLVMVDLAGGNGVPDGDYYYGHDHLYSVYALFDAGGLVAERYYYDAYGKTRIYKSDYSASQATSQYGNPYTFTGRRLDALDNGSLKLMYYRARTYDPQTGRFMQRDPLGIEPAGGKLFQFTPIRQYSDGLNVYEYVKSNSIINTDPLGFISSGSVGEYVSDDGVFNCDCAKDYFKRDSFGLSSNLNWAFAFSWWSEGKGESLWFNHQSKLAQRVKTGGSIPSTLNDIKGTIVSIAKNYGKKMKPRSCNTMSHSGKAGEYAFTGWLFPVLGRGRDDSYSTFRYRAICCLKRDCCSLETKCSVRYTLRDKYTFDESIIIGDIPGREGRNYWINITFYHDFQLIQKVPVNFRIFINVLSGWS